MNPANIEGTGVDQRKDGEKEHKGIEGAKY